MLINLAFQTILNSYLYLHKLTCYIKNIQDITMDNMLTAVPDDAATRETNPKKNLSVCLHVHKQTKKINNLRRAFFLFQIQIFEK